ncbi:TPA: RNA-processing protein [Candidatus Bathyarchaeota archaeon]|nr:RNA-processing protein [Candidatus Bathyarchaeota archaeon]
MSEVSILIPKARIGALIGRKGEVKGKIEKTLKVTLKVDGESGLVKIEPGEGADALSTLKARDVVNAIARGFSPEKAFKLFNEDAMLEILDLRDIIGRSENALERLKGRVIGKDGKTRRLIEELTGAYVSVYGHTIAIIGNYDSLSIAREAVDMLLKGRQHSTVYRFLGVKRREMKRRQRVELWEKPPT